MKCGNVLPGFRYAAFAFLFFSARNLAHRNFVAFEILALAAADITRFLTSVTSRVVLLPNAFAAARTPLNLPCNLLSSFSSFRSSRLIAASRSMNPPHGIYPRSEVIRQTYSKRKVTSAGRRSLRDPLIGTYPADTGRMELELLRENSFAGACLAPILGLSPEGRQSH